MTTVLDDNIHNFAGLISLAPRHFIL